MPAPGPSLAQVRALLAAQAPGLAGLALRALPGGMDNAVVRVGPHLLARLPRTPAASVLLRHEQRWLPELSPRLPLPVPVPVLHGRPGAGYPHLWSLVRWRRGRTADTTAPDAAALVGALAGFLRALHLPAPPGAPGNPFRGVPLRARVRRHAVALAGHPRAPQLRAALDDLAAVPGPTGPPVWVHGDLHPRNLLVHAGRLTSVLDFGDLHAGDRAVDLAVAWMLLPDQPREALRGVLAVDDATWQRARGWALVLGALLREVGLREADEAFRRLGERTLDAACPP